MQCRSTPDADWASLSSHLISFDGTGMISTGSHGISEMDHLDVAIRNVKVVKAPRPSNADIVSEYSIAIDDLSNLEEPSTPRASSLSGSIFTPSAAAGESANQEACTKPRTLALEVGAADSQKMDELESKGFSTKPAKRDLGFYKEPSTPRSSFCDRATSKFSTGVTKSKIVTPLSPGKWIVKKGKMERLGSSLAGCSNVGRVSCFERRASSVHRISGGGETAREEFLGFCSKKRRSSVIESTRSDVTISPTVSSVFQSTAGGWSNQQDQEAYSGLRTYLDCSSPRAASAGELGFAPLSDNASVYPPTFQVFNMQAGLVRTEMRHQSPTPPEVDGFAYAPLAMLMLPPPSRIPPVHQSYLPQAPGLVLHPCLPPTPGLVLPAMCYPSTQGPSSLH
ncbi:hypothetical protein CEUSTIGMA_g6988.t1 [Chlamydomonas eustigma]|uniref:Uncharacterized protein n=1 Tax=Chlamydomonas eustigma TaxID=1157962 RepID=A0A250X918_9CHLO|nr:hypothetical protein CEUSTIGMA_g6988.t1 [Chlamydomonas eustigma]|eukprot:GAX79547.1 hypothetical protein CEUSTIGMA_g6988.t1 [Chlamydomonas eustigma]